MLKEAMNEMEEVLESIQEQVSELGADSSPTNEPKDLSAITGQLAELRTRVDSLDQTVQEQAAGIVTIRNDFEAVEESVALVHSLRESVGELEETVESFQNLEEMSNCLEELQQSVSELQDADIGTRQDFGSSSGSSKGFERLQRDVEELMQEVGSAKPLASVDQIDGLWDRVRELGKALENSR